MIKKTFADIKYFAASHEDESEPGVLKKVLLTWEELPKGRRLQMINWATLPSGKRFRKHFHQDMDEIFIIISGVAEISVNGEKELLSRGDAVLVPVRAVHTMQNKTKKDAHYLVVGLSQGKGGQTIVI